MNFNNYTTKSQETIQLAQQLAQGLGHNQIENEHIFKALTQIDKNVLPFLNHHTVWLNENSWYFYTLFFFL